MLCSLLLSQANLHCIAVATPKELVEMDITHLLNPPAWLEDDTEYDIECIGCVTDTCPSHSIPERRQLHFWSL